LADKTEFWTQWTSEWRENVLCIRLSDGSLAEHDHKLREASGHPSSKRKALDGRQEFDDVANRYSLTADLRT